jgi:glycosyltransferase involved in cell wall biosynthesis
MTVLQVCAFGAEHPGNFIASLEALESALAVKGVKTIYAFVERAADKDWCKKISKRTAVYFLPEAKARILPKTYQVMRKIYAENQVDIVHTHFELYDIPATVTAPQNTKVFWHLHDPIVPGSGLRSILWKLQYGHVGKRATLLSVADYYRNVVVALGFPKNQTRLVLNGIDLNRVERKTTQKNHEYDFLTFGWDFERKGDDLIVRACNKLEQDGYEFKLLLNGNETTWSELDDFLGGKTPSYLVKGNPVKDVSRLFEKSKIFIQASRRETFSYAVCEAAYAGLPVISSDIAGLEWAHALPTVSFFENEDVDGLYAQMKEFLDGKLVPETDVCASQAHIKENLSMEAWAHSIIGYYGLEE